MKVTKVYNGDKVINSIYYNNSKILYGLSVVPTNYTIKTTKSGTFSISLSSNNPQGKSITIDFGNGNILSYPLTSTLKTIVMNYSDTSEKYITITNADIISTFICNDMSISDLNLSSFNNIEKLVCYNNNIISLDFSNNPLIQYIHCFNNPLILNDTNLLNMINTLLDRNNKAYGSIIIDNRVQMLKVEPTSIKKDWLFGSAIMYNTTEWGKCGYHFKQTGVADIWESGDMGEGVTIGILDVGFDLRCVEYPSDCIVGMRNFSNQGTTTEVPQPTSGQPNHGNRVSSILVAQGLKMYGICPKAKLFLIKTADTASISYTNWVTSAITFAKTQSIDLLNYSSNGSTYYAPLEAALKDYCVSKGSYTGRPFVNSAGNTGDGTPTTDEIMYPGYYKYPVVVASLSSSNTLASNSSSYNGLDIASYGVSIYKQEAYNSYSTSSGTSYAAPIVTGVLALLINIFKKKNSRKPSEKELYQELIKRTIVMNNTIKEVGVGRLQLMSYNPNPAVIQHT